MILMVRVVNQSCNDTCIVEAQGHKQADPNSQNNISRQRTISNPTQ